MAKLRRRRSNGGGHRRLQEATEILQVLGFDPKQRNRSATLTLLALLDLTSRKEWNKAAAPLLGITPIIEFIRRAYRFAYAPNTRETIRDENVKYFVDSGLVIKNPDDPTRPTTSAKTVYQIEKTALTLFRSFGTRRWKLRLQAYLKKWDSIRQAEEKRRNRARIPIRLPSGKHIRLSPGGQNPLIKEIIEQFCERFVHRGVLVYVGDTENKSEHLEKEYLRRLGVSIPLAEKMPDVIVHDRKRKWLILIEAVTSAGHVDRKRRGELKRLFRNKKSGLVFVTAFPDRATMRRFLPSLAWETEVWVAEAPDHLIHFNGERFLGPHPE